MHRSSLIKPSILPLLVAVAAAGCRQEPEASNNVVEEPIVNLPSVVRPSPPLDRAALIAAVGQAASAAAAGAAASPDLRELDGRQFEVRIRFGCRGPSPDDSNNWLTWSYDPDSRRISVRARPTISADDALVASIGGEGIEAAEGFWIPRPWLLQPVCPAAAAVQRAPQPEPEQAGAAAEAGESEASAQGPEPLPVRQRVGIAQFFTETDPRTRRRDSRPYQAAHRLKEGQALGSQGFNLVLAGRLRALPGRGVIECVALGADSPPDCIVSAEFQRVWIEQPESREVIAEWGGG